MLKLKTKEFNSLTRSLTPASPPSSCEDLTSIALTLRERVQLGPKQLFRLVGVGLTNFSNEEGERASLFNSEQFLSGIESEKRRVTLYQWDTRVLRENLRVPRLTEVWWSRRDLVCSLLAWP